MTTKQMKLAYKQLNKKERSLLKVINNYRTLISSLLVEIRGLGEKLDATFTKETLLRLQKEKSKIESDLVAIRFEKGILNAQIKGIFSRIRMSDSIEELFDSLNEKYMSYAIPIQFDYQYDKVNDDVNGVIFYKVSAREV